MVKKAWKVYGAEGHRQSESFYESYKYNWSNEKLVRIIEVFNSDKTGTNDYSIIAITRNSEEECFEELWGQIYDGIFEDCRTGQLVEISLDDLPQKETNQ